MNDYFKENKGRLVVSVTYAGADLDGTSKFLVAFTKTVSEKESAWLSRYGQKVREEMAKETDEQEEMDRKNQAEQLRQDAEARRLAQVGKTCEAHHAPLVEENRALKKKKGKS